MTGPQTRSRSRWSRTDRATRTALGVVVAFCVVQAAVWLPVSETATSVMFGSARVVLVAVWCVWGFRWAVRWRRDGVDAVSDLTVGAAAQRLLRVCAAVVFVHGVVFGVAGPAVFDLPRPVLLTMFGAFLAAAICAVVIAVADDVVSTRQMAADRRRLDELIRELHPPSNGSSAG